MNDIQKHVYHIIRTIDQKGECGVSGAVDLSLTLGHLITCQTTMQNTFMGLTCIRLGENNV